MSRVGGIAAVVVVAALLPILVSGYYLDIVATAIAFGIFALSVDLLWGVAGILNLGMAAFFGLGAYTAGLMLKHFGTGWSILPALLGAAAVPVLLTVVIGYAGFRLKVKQIYYALITLAVTLVLERVAITWRSLTGGSNGLTGIPRPRLAGEGLDVSPAVIYYYGVVVVALGLLWIVQRLRASPMGRILLAIRSDELKVVTLGYNVTRYKLIASSIAAGVAGVAGALFVPINGIAYPALFGVGSSLQAFVWVAVGGPGTIIGPFLCAVVLKLLEATLRGVSESTYLLFLGILYLLVVRFVPGGFMSLLHGAREFRVWVRKVVNGSAPTGLGSSRPS